MFRLPFNEPLLAEPPIDGVDNSAESTLDILMEDSPDVSDENTGELDSDKSRDVEEDSEVEEISEETEESEEQDPEEELKELEEELSEEVDDEKLELTTPVRRKEILKKYPNLFKDFPYLEHAYYREQQFTELLPTIADAKVAVEKADVLDKFESDLVRGDTTKILETVRKVDPNAFNKIVDDYLPTLARVDERAYHHVLSNVLKETIVLMVKESQASGNDVLKSAAQILNQFAFGSSTFTPAQRLSREESPNPEEEHLRQRETNFAKQRYETTRDELNTRVNNQIKATLETNIDPKNTMTEYIRKNVVRDAQIELQSMLEKDKRFKLIVDKLWENAHRSDYSKDSVDKIRSAFVAKTKTLLPSVIKKARIEGLRGMGKRVRISTKDTDESVETPSHKADGQPKAKTSSPKVNTKGRPEVEAKKIPSNMSTLDFLMQD